MAAVPAIIVPPITQAELDHIAVNHVFRSSTASVFFVDPNGDNIARDVVVEHCRNRFFQAGPDQLSCNGDLNITTAETVVSLRALNVREDAPVVGHEHGFAQASIKIMRSRLVLARTSIINAVMTYRNTQALQQANAGALALVNQAFVGVNQQQQQQQSQLLDIVHWMINDATERQQLFVYHAVYGPCKSKNILFLYQLDVWQVVLCLKGKITS